MRRGAVLEDTRRANTYRERNSRCQSPSLSTSPGEPSRGYEQVSAALFPNGELPEGWMVHVAGPTESGWRVVNVVPSQEEFETFARDTLLPATRKVGDEPPLAFFSVHRLIR